MHFISRIQKAIVIQLENHGVGEYLDGMGGSTSRFAIWYDRAAEVLQWLTGTK